MSEDKLTALKLAFETLIDACIPEDIDECVLCHAGPDDEEHSSGCAVGKAVETLCELFEGKQS